MEKIPDGTQLGLDLSGEHENYLLADERKKLQENNYSLRNQSLIKEKGLWYVERPNGNITVEEWLLRKGNEVPDNLRLTKNEEDNQWYIRTSDEKVQLFSEWAELRRLAEEGDKEENSTDKYRRGGF